MLYCTVCSQSNIPVLATAFGNPAKCSTIASNSNIVTDHVPPHLKMGYDEASDYPLGTHITVAWLKICVRALCDCLIQLPMCSVPYAQSICPLIWRLKGFKVTNNLYSFECVKWLSRSLCHFFYILSFSNSVYKNSTSVMINAKH